MSLSDSFDRLARHLEVERAVLASGGRVVASFELDADGRTIGARLTSNRMYRCSSCGQDGHSRERCNGPGQPPKPTYEQRRTQARIERLNRQADRSLDAAKAELAKRITSKERK